MENATLFLCRPGRKTRELFRNKPWDTTGVFEEHDPTKDVEAAAAVASIPFLVRVQFRVWIVGLYRGWSPCRERSRSVKCKSDNKPRRYGQLSMSRGLGPATFAGNGSGEHQSSFGQYSQNARPDRIDFSTPKYSQNGAGLDMTHILTTTDDVPDCGPPPPNQNNHKSHCWMEISYLLNTRSQSEIDMPDGTRNTKIFIPSFHSIDNNNNCIIR